MPGRAPGAPAEESPAYAETLKAACSKRLDSGHSEGDGAVAPAALLAFAPA